MDTKKSPASAGARWALAREFENLRFDALNASYTAERLHEQQAAPTLASMVAPEKLDKMIKHLAVVVTFVEEVREEIRKLSAAPAAVAGQQGPTQG